jgi:hypothetical protein
VTLGAGTSRGLVSTFSASLRNRFERLFSQLRSTPASEQRERAKSALADAFTDYFAECDLKNSSTVR